MTQAQVRTTRNNKYNYRSKKKKNLPIKPTYEQEKFYGLLSTSINGDNFFFSIREDKKYYKINTKYHIAVLTINIQDVKRSR